MQVSRGLKLKRNKDSENERIFFKLQMYSTGDRKGHGCSRGNPAHSVSSSSLAALRWVGQILGFLETQFGAH